MNYYIFLDMDGVISLHGGIKKHLAQNLSDFLSYLEEKEYQPKIVFNSAWNVRHKSVEKYVEPFGETGVDISSYFCDTTNSGRGGPIPIRAWMKENNIEQCRYIILDDTGFTWGSMWGRVVKTRLTEGFTRLKLQEACALVERGVVPETEFKICSEIVKGRYKEFRSEGTYPNAIERALQDLNEVSFLNKNNFLKGANLI